MDLPPDAGEELHYLCFGRTDLKTSRRTEGSQGIDKPLQLEGAIRKESEVEVQTANKIKLDVTYDMRIDAVLCTQACVDRRLHAVSVQGSVHN